MSTRRDFLLKTRTAGLSALAASPLAAAKTPPATNLSEPLQTDVVSLDGAWVFCTDPNQSGIAQRWFAGGSDAREWRTVTVPHTWQVEQALTEYRGVAWYRRTFDMRAHWRDAAIRVEFEAVFHSAEVWVNDARAGEHIGKAYTAFTLDLTKLLKWDAPNTIAVRVDNSFSENMLPRGRSSDWAHDGGIYRPVQLLVSPRTFIERVNVDAQPDLASGTAQIDVKALIRNAAPQAWKGQLAVQVIDDASGLAVLMRSGVAELSVGGSSTGVATFSVSFANVKLWHFDHPNLYRLIVTLSDGHAAAHQLETTFGVRKFEVRNAAFFLNGERVRLMGVERMAGSNPEFGMAEPEAWIAHDHDDLKNLNCIFTRVHWPQDKRVLDYCDKRGIMIQTEVPTWGPDTFKGMGEQPDPTIMRNGLEQLGEMIARDGNHPCIVSWGLCNEIGGQNPPAYNFAKNMLSEAKRLNPSRLCSYASHSLRETPAKDVAGLMDFIECNEYYGSWYPGDGATAGRNVDEIHAAFPDKPIVISEYGYCACAADRPEGDERRREVMKTHDEALRARDFVGGLIFFCYNDYRTHIGDFGIGAMKQRIHGVVDLYGAPKGSYELLRNESSPVETIVVEGHPTAFQVTVRTRKTVPAHTLRGYKLRAVYYGFGEIPAERKEVELAELQPGESAMMEVAFSGAAPWRVQFDVLRPTGFSAYTLQWKA